jgi:antitoxin component of RelBE/YafQ-DinJ toxin-antitoxin module
MIKKSVFENEIINNMQRNLTESSIEEGMYSVDKAVDYLNSAIDVFEDLGMYSKADQILNILSKIASYKVITKMPSIAAVKQALMQHGLDLKDIDILSKETTFENLSTKKKIVKILKELGLSDENIVQNFGEKALEDVELSFESLSPKDNSKENEFVFESMADKKNKKVSDPHTKKLNSKKMIENLLHHGTEFNLSDDDILEDE